MNKVDLTYSGELKGYSGELEGLYNVVKKNVFLVNYTIDGKIGKTTTTSILINPDTMEMITFDYQDLKKLVGDSNDI